MRSVLLAFLALVGACTNSGGAEPTTTGQAPATSTSTSTTIATTTTTTLPPTTTLPEPTTTLDVTSAALVTPTGVVTALLEQTQGGYLVLTPCGEEKLVGNGTPIGGTSVVIDPGHGGEVDTGAVGSNGLAEKDLNLQVAQAVEAKLIVRGVPVILTRTGDYASTLTVRAGLADHVGADLLLSVHHNAPTPGTSSHPGTEVFVQHDSEDSKRLGGLVWSHVMEALAGFDANWTAATDAGVLVVLSTRGNDAYGMIRNPETVSALAELGYISNPSEAQLFATDAYVEAAAEALADALQAYLGTDSPGAGFQREPRVFNPQPGIGGSACVDPVLE